MPLPPTFNLNTLSLLEFLEFFTKIEVFDLFLSEYTNEVYLGLFEALKALKDKIENIKLYLLADVLLCKIRL